MDGGALQMTGVSLHNSIAVSIAYFAHLGPPWTFRRKLGTEDKLSTSSLYQTASDTCRCGHDSRRHTFGINEFLLFSFRCWGARRMHTYTHSYTHSLLLQHSNCRYWIHAEIVRLKVIISAVFFNLTTNQNVSADLLSRFSSPVLPDVNVSRLEQRC